MTLSPLHYLNAAAEEGRFQRKSKYPSDPAQVDALIHHLENNKVTKLTLHFHGGLVSEERGLEVAANMAPVYEGISHSLGIAWGSGFMETLIERLDLLEKTDLFRELRKIVLRKVLEEIGIQDGSRGYFIADDALLADEMNSAQPFAHFDQQARQAVEHWDALTLATTEAKISADLTSEIDEYHVVVLTVKKQGPDDPYYQKDHLIPDTESVTGEKGIITVKLVLPLAKVIIRVITRFWEKTDHGIVPTILEELMREFYLADLGEQLWLGMKEKAAALWTSNAGLPEQDWRAGRYLLDALMKHKEKYPNFEINLVGHSAGSIVICHLLKCLEENYLNLLPVKNIIFLAPACRTDLFASEVMEKPQRYNRFRMFTMEDAYEKKDNCGRVYGNSLLYLVAGVFELETHASILGLIRQLSDSKPYQQDKLLQTVRAFIYESGKERLVTSPTDDHAPQGFRCRAFKHGGFDEEMETRTSLAFIVAQ